MEENTTSSTPAAGKNKMLPVIVIVVIILLLGAGYFAYKAYKANKNQAAMNVQTTPAVTVSPASNAASASPTKMGQMNMTAGSPSPLSALQQSQLASGSSKTTTQKKFNITGGNFYFTPNKITVNKGDSVTFILTDADGVHNLKIDELGVSMPTLRSAGDSETVTFTASQTGSFVFYCSIPGHRQKGMWGTLVVQ